jgi:hypothetical protein
VPIWRIEAPSSTNDRNKAPPTAVKDIIAPERL